MDTKLIEYWENAAARHEAEWKKHWGVERSADPRILLLERCGAV